MATQFVQRRGEEPAESAPEAQHNRRVYSPRVDILEGDKELLVIADVPGADESTIGISLEKSILTISARIASHDPKDRPGIRREYEIGDFERSFTLSDVVDQEKIQASVKDGVLRLILPKAAPAQAKRIAVSAG